MTILGKSMTTRAKLGAVARRRTMRALIALVAIAVTGSAVWGVLSLRAQLELAERAWPVTVAEKASLVSMTLVFSLGLAVALTGVVRLVGWRQRDDVRRRELARLEREALTDNLTGLRNRRSFDEDMNREIERRNRTGASFALLMVDLNGLKRINDSAGHQAGDRKIRAAAECLRETFRGSDCAYRIGGDEFAVLLPGERAWGGLTFAQRLHASAARRDVGVTVGVTESIGTESGQSLIRQADVALYEAKRSRLSTAVYNPGMDAQAAGRTRMSAPGPRDLLVTALAHVVDARDTATRNHCETVAEVCALVARELGLEPERIERVRIAGLLHDVGKIGIADAILQKPAELARDEVAILSTHPAIGRDIVSAGDLEEEAAWVLHHHEHWDGSGYPDGLTGEAIPLESRIILVADAFEAIISERPYRSRRSPEEALEEIVSNAGTQFDPKCVAALCAVFRHEPSVRLDELAARRREREARGEVSTLG
jgi:diguanylate cyclase (GGDEF)-like protein